MTMAATLSPPSRPSAYMDSVLGLIALLATAIIITLVFVIRRLTGMTSSVSYLTTEEDRQGEREEA